VLILILSGIQYPAADDALQRRWHLPIKTRVVVVCSQLLIMPETEYCSPVSYCVVV